MSLLEELKWRGMIQEYSPDAEAFLRQQPTAVYLGADPTADSLHIGHLVPIMMLMHLQRAGHHPIALVGGATGLIGDPSGKDKERSLQTIAQVQANSEAIRRQMAQFLDFDTPVNPARMVNNYDWFKDIGFIDFLREVGKHVTVSYMLSKESVRKRMDSDQGISYTEFAYQLMQGYDFLYLYEHFGVRVQVGGSDQWGNILTGAELIRRKLGGEAYGITCPLMTRADGSKFGKTADGESLWLDPRKTTPYQFFQYWMNVSDEDALRFIKIFTVINRQEIEALAATHSTDPSRRVLHQALAEDLTRRVHGEQGLQSAHRLTDFHFARQAPLDQLSLADWEEVADSPDKKQIDASLLLASPLLTEVMTDLGIVASKSEARRAIEADKSVSLNGQKIASQEARISPKDLYFNRFFQIQKGKKQKFIIEALHHDQG